MLACIHMTVKKQQNKSTESNKVHMYVMIIQQLNAAQHDKGIEKKLHHIHIDIYIYIYTCT